jgi:flagellar biosynthesis GTPase FlhF
VKNQKQKKRTTTHNHSIHYIPEEQRVKKDTKAKKPKEQKVIKNKPDYDDLLKDILIDIKIDPDKIVPFHEYPEEDDDGPVEYKLKLKAISMERLEQLITQMKFRLHEGGGECIYHVGLLDNGDPLGINEKELETSLKTLCLMTQKLEANMDILTYTEGKQGLIAEVLITRAKFKEENIKHKNEIKVGLVGEEGSGKSTLVYNRVILDWLSC